MERKGKEPHSARKRLALRLRSERAIRGLSQEQLADLAGLHRTYVGSIERSERNVSIDNIEQLADALGLDIAVLLAPA
jgi:transcriptional regulator with XRE-family HTH domain